MQNIPDSSKATHECRVHVSYSDTTSNSANVISALVQAFYNGKDIAGTVTNYDGDAILEIPEKYPAVIISASYLGGIADTLINNSVANEKLELFVPRGKPLNWLNTYNRKQALADLRKGEPMILYIGINWNNQDSVRNGITHKYGFILHPTTDVIIGGSNLFKAVDEYNTVMYRYLDMVNPKGWRQQLNVELKGLFQVNEK